MRVSAAVAGGIAAVALGGALLTGCGGDDEGGAAATSSVEVQMDDFKFVPSDLTLTAGTVKLTSENVGKVEHELEILKTDDDPASFPVVGGRVDTEALEKAGAEEIGELEAEAGETVEGTFDLESGKYAMICNLPAHYEQGMYGSITVE